MLKTPRFFHARRFVALAALVSLASCSGGGCGNCTVPAFTAPSPGTSPGPFFTPTPSPIPTATPIPTPTPTPTPAPIALSCAQNAILPNQSVPLGTAANFAILAGQTATNGGVATINGDLGVSPGNSQTGFGPGTTGTVNGSIWLAVPTAANAQLDLTTAYNSAAGKPATVTLLGGTDIGGTTLPAGVYHSPSTLFITGPLVLNGGGNPNAVFIFQIGSGLTTAVGSTVNLIGLANPCNVFWQVGSSATINGATFSGNILAFSSITMGLTTTMNGRALARNAAVTIPITAVDTISKPGP
ncbi:MAG: hypothetical protein JWN27_1650 [Candidatus Eremiobacteraeota bacterium]|nr:hypothetical protein [Candidatus Eremiobacteraeota bacterium]